MKLRQPSLGTSGDLLAVFDQLHARALADGGVGLLGLNADLLQHDALGMGAAGEGLPLRAQMRLLVVLVCPQVLAALDLQLAASAHSARLPHGCWCRPAKASAVAAAGSPMYSA